jgi:maltose O-acetyltransferase
MGTGGYVFDTRIASPRNVSIGDRVSFGGRVYLNAAAEITIGNDCMIGYGATLTTATHDPSAAQMNQTFLSEPIAVGNNVWIGTGATILPGVDLADGTVVGAGAVVTRSVYEPNTIIAGVPARHLRDRLECVDAGEPTITRGTRSTNSEAA